MNTPADTDYVYEIIKQIPNIDTPSVCLSMLVAEGVEKDEDLPEGVELARWLNEWYQERWVSTCRAVDWLIETGKITFSDDGELDIVQGLCAC